MKHYKIFCVLGIHSYDDGEVSDIRHGATWIRCKCIKCNHTIEFIRPS